MKAPLHSKTWNRVAILKADSGCHTSRPPPTAPRHPASGPQGHSRKLRPYTPYNYEMG